MLAIYKSTGTFPAAEQFGITSQMRRASISITSNIAEGFGRSTSKDQERFYVMAYGSATELENQIIACRDLSFIDSLTFGALESDVKGVQQLLNGLLRAHRQRNKARLQPSDI